MPIIYTIFVLFISKHYYFGFLFDIITAKEISILLTLSIKKILHILFETKLGNYNINYLIRTFK